METSKQQKSKRKLRAFHQIQKNFADLGIQPNSANQTGPMNAKVFAGLLVLVLGIIFMLVFIFNEAKTFNDYIQSSYTCSLATFAVFVLVILILKVGELFEFFKTVDSIINTSKR